VISLTASLQAALRERSKRDRGVFRKLGLKLVLMEQESHFREFYSSMLVPTVTKRHGAHAHIADYSRLREVFQRGWLLGFFDGDEWLAGYLLEPEGTNGVRSANIGWRHGEEEILRRHIVQACQYAVVEWASARGFHFFNLGSCNPFINDGVLVYKLRYNVVLKLPQITYAEGKVEGARGYVAAKYDLASEGGRSILEHAPVIEKGAGGPGVIAWRSETPSTFRHMIADGLPWRDLAEAKEPNHIRRGQIPGLAQE
jgi:hypothetical protein